MLLSQKIAAMLEEMLEEGNGELSIVRNELASRVGCVPSQINYVLTSRFTPERGYLVESRRGGGGYVRIRKISMGKDEYLMHFYQAIGDSLGREEAQYFLSRLASENILTVSEARLASAMLSDNAMARVSREGRDTLRADLLKSAVLQLLWDKED